MSYDRVLPKPVALHYEPNPVALQRPTSSLLEHKIMNDDFSHKMAWMDRAGTASPAALPPYQRAKSAGSDDDAGGDGESLPSLAPINGSKFASNNKLAVSAPVKHASKSISPLLTKDIPNRDRSSSSSSPKSSTMKDTVQFCLCQPDPKIPRPRNAFILYRQHYQSSVVAQFPAMSNPQISKVIGEHWRALPDEIKNEWKALAEEEKARHQQQYPEYRYQPRRYGRDGGRSATAGVSYDSNGSTVCNRCGGRVMNPPSSPSPDGLFSSSGLPSLNTASPHPSNGPIRNLQCCTKDSECGPSPMIIEPKPRQRHLEGSGGQSPGYKRRRSNFSAAYRANGQRDRRSPDSPYPGTPYTPLSDMAGSRGFLQPAGPYQNFRERQNPGMRLPPLQTTGNGPTNAATPVTSFPHDESDVETTVMTIPFLNKINVLARISPPLTPSFRDPSSPRGLVIAVDGQDNNSVNSMVEHLRNTLVREGKYTVRVFEGPEIRPSSPSNPEYRSATAEYVDLISAWHRVSGEIVNFVKGGGGGSMPDTTMTTPETQPMELEPAHNSGPSPKTIIPKTAKLNISSPKSRPSDGESDYSSSSNRNTPAETPTPGPDSIPIALVPRYQLTTADTYACSIPLFDSYRPLDHWQWMATLWRACVGPDVTVYIRECERDELARYGGGNPVEVRLNDARTVVVRRPMSSPGELEEKALKRVGFEIEDYLTQ